MEICAGQCRYLLSIYHLGQESRTIRCVDIAKDLGVTRPSVSKMMKCMVRMELIYPDYGEAVRLTGKGRELAAVLNQNYDLIYAFFRRMLRLSPEEAKEHTFLFLSDYPQSTCRRLAEIMQKSMDASRKRRKVSEEK